MNQNFNETAVERLQNFLKKNKQSGEFEILTPDASTREYFRINWKNSPAIACVYAEVFLPKEHTYLDVTNLFLACDLPVAEIYAFDSESGIIVQEDFGDKILRDVLLESEEKEKKRLLNEAIRLIAKIQAATPKAFELSSIASRLKFDEEKLLWELNFFKTHYFESLRKEKLSEPEDKLLNSEFTELARELEKHAKVLCHRDFHAANLMVDHSNKLRIIDHQDARIGSVAYDLVSLLLDRILQPPDNDWLKEKKRFFLAEREGLGLEKIDKTEFDNDFDLMTVQRCLKAIGTFSFQSALRGKTQYVQYIEPMFRAVLQACEKLEKFPHLRKTITDNF